MQLPVGIALAALAQIVGVLLALAVAIIAWGWLGALGWLAAVLYVGGQQMLPDAPPEAPDTTDLRGL